MSQEVFVVGCKRIVTEITQEPLQEHNYFYEYLGFDNNDRPYLSSIHDASIFNSIHYAWEFAKDAHRMIIKEYHNTHLINELKCFKLNLELIPDFNINEVPARTMEYDEKGNLIHIDYGTGREEFFEYDLNSHLTRSYIKQNGQIISDWDWEYDEETKKYIHKLYKYSCEINELLPPTV